MAQLQLMPHSVTRLYFEAHITVDPSPTEAMYRNKTPVDYESFCFAAEALGWKCSKFDHDDVDGIAGMWFMSAKSGKWEVIQVDVLNTVATLEAAGYTVARAKIENAVWDTKYGDNY